MNAREVARRLGGEPVGPDRVLVPGPGHSPSDRSLQITFSAVSRDGFVVFSFAGDDWRQCRDYVRTRLGWSPQDRAAIEREVNDRSPAQDETKRIERAQELWAEWIHPHGTLAQTYLSWRGLALNDDIAGRVLRFHPRCPWRNENSGKTERVPALIVAFRSLDDDSISAIHRIALTPDGRKIARRAFGIMKRAAAKLDVLSGDTLAIGEGVETCMAARELGITPTWSVGSAGMITHFPVLPNITTLRILGERDAANEEAAHLCGKRWQAAGRAVSVIMPPLGCKDLNDSVRREKNLGRTE